MCLAQNNHVFGLCVWPVDSHVFGLRQKCVWPVDGHVFGPRQSCVWSVDSNVFGL